MSKKAKAHGASDFERLVSELIKTKPNLGVVSELSDKVGIPFRGDLIEQMGAVLKMADCISRPDNTKKELET